MLSSCPPRAFIGPPGCGSRSHTLAKTPTRSTLLPEDDSPLSNSSAFMSVSSTGQAFFPLTQQPESVNTLLKHTFYSCVFLLIVKLPETKRYKIVVEPGTVILTEAVGLADHGSLFSIVEFVFACTVCCQ